MSMGLLITLAVMALSSATAVYAAWLYTGQSNGMKVLVSGSNIGVFLDSGLTQPITTTTTTFDFGKVYCTGLSSNTVNLYVKNLGTEPLRVNATETGLNAALQLVDATYGIIGTTATPLYTPAKVAGFTPGTYTGGSAGLLTSGSTITASQTTIGITNGADWTGLSPAPTLPCYAKFNDGTGEIIEITGISGVTLTVVRGVDGTTASIHNGSNPTMNLGTYQAPVSEVDLAPGAVLNLVWNLQSANQTPNNTSLNALLGQELTGMTVQLDATSTTGY